MMENVLFYGFSTLASAFGSAVGLIVAAAIFRMQKLDQIGSNLFDLLANDITDPERKVRMSRVRAVHDWKKHREVWTEAWRGIQHTDTPDQEHMHALLGKIRNRIGFIRWSIRLLVPLTLLLIGLCFAGIGMTLCLKTQNQWSIHNPICGHMSSVNPYLAIAITWAAVLLIGYGVLVWRLVSEVDFDFSKKKWWQFWKKA
jgi:hypothetical protein